MRVKQSKGSENRGVHSTNHAVSIDNKRPLRVERWHLEEKKPEAYVWRVKPKLRKGEL